MTSSIRIVRPVLAIVAVIIAIAMLGSMPAAAHTELRGSSPEEGATVEQLDQVRLEFSSALLDVGSELAIVDSAGETHELTPELPADSQSVVGAVDGTALPAGQTVLDWRIVAEDGHPIEGEIHFTYAPPASEAPADEPTPTQEAAPVNEPEPAGEPQTTDESAPPADVEPISAEVDTESDSTPVWIGVVIALAAVAAVAAAIVMVRRRDNT